MEKEKGRFTKGNQRARKHGYYSKVLDEEQKLDFKHAIEVEGLDEEIALIRVKIKSLMKHDPDNLKLIGQAVKILATLVCAKYNIGKGDKNSWRAAIENVVANIGERVGVDFIERAIGK